MYFMFKTPMDISKLHSVRSKFDPCDIFLVKTTNGLTLSVPGNASQWLIGQFRVSFSVTHSSEKNNTETRVV